jgi:phosphoglycolate phosphatase-like HAD superfamily hydrolase
MSQILFVWDFHGVLEKGNEYALQEVINQVLEEFKFKRRAAIEEILLLAGKSWKDHYRHFLPGVSDEILSSMANRSNELGMPAAKKFTRPNDFAADVLSQITGHGSKSIVISHTQKDAVKFFTDLVGITEFVDAHFATDLQDNNSTIAEAKIAAINKYMKGRNFDKIVFVGDSEHDIEAGLSVGAVTYLFSTDMKRASRTKAHHVISDLREVLKELPQNSAI